MPGIDRGSVRIAFVTACALLIPSAPTHADWDVTDTGQPYADVQFTVTEGTWMSLDVSPDGRRLVFDLLGDLYSLPARGGDATLIHGGPAVEHSPRFSPDGTKILYISDRGGSENLWLSNADGSAARQVTHETFSTLSTPAWGAGGRYVAATRFSSRKADGGGVDVRLYHLDGGRGRALARAANNGYEVHEPHFSRDGRYVYYTEHVYAPAIGNANQPMYAVERRDLSDGKVDEVVRGFGGATTPQVSPDGSKLAFVRRVKARTVLFVYDLQTGEQRPVYDDLDTDMQIAFGARPGGYYPRYGWFPDNRHVAIWGKGRLYEIDMQTQARQEIPFRVLARHRITAPPRFENPLVPEPLKICALQQVAVAPDGKNAVFNALGHLWRASLPGGKPQRLTSADTFEFEPSYSPEGTHIAYVSWADELGSALELVTAQGRAVRTLVRGAGAIIRQPSFSPDGKRLVYWVEQGNKTMGGYRGKGGLYWISLADGQPHYIGGSGASLAKSPRFSPDGRRIYYVSKGTILQGLTEVNNALESVDLQGLDKRVHVFSEEAGEFRISPDLRWLAYKQDQQYYLVPYRETGATLKLTRGGNEMPVTQLTGYGGYELTWSADSRRVSWVLGPSLFGISVDETVANIKPAVAETKLDLEVAADKPEGVLAFANGRIVTMKGEGRNGDLAIERGSIVVKGNHIVAVGPADSVEIPADAKVIDVAGKTVMPGLVDMHGHLDYREEDLLMPQKHPSHYAALAFGVTTNLDPSSTEVPSFAASEMNRAGVTVGPRLISAGAKIFGPDGLGAFQPITSLDDARRIAARKRALGGIILKGYMQPMRSQRQQLIKAAREARLMVTPEGAADFYGNIGMILDGHVSIEHNLPAATLYDDLIQLISRSGTSLTPTVIVTTGETAGENYFYQTTRPWDDPKVRLYVQRLGRYSNVSAPDAPPYARGMVTIHQADELWDIGFRSVARSLKKLDDAGGVVNTGGHGQLQGLDMHWEMWALAEGGMSNYRVLRAATLNGARTIGLDKQIGTLEAGKLADLIVLDGNPLESIRNTNTVRYTVVNGRMYDALTMNEIGNYDRPRGKFYWELQDYRGIDWNEAWGGPGIHPQ